MSNYLRNYAPGGTYFFTVVTHERRPILCTDLGRECLRVSIESVCDRPRWRFEIVAMVLLPDHFHIVITLPDGDSDYSTRIKRVKEEFTNFYLARGGTEGRVSPSRRKKGERGVWQRRFWEHTCETERDLKQHVDYSHYNPVKHGYVERVIDYPWSTFHRFVLEGEYDAGWGKTEPMFKMSSSMWDSGVDWS